MSDISKAYEPQAVEERWYQFWLDQQCFTADPARVSDRRPAYSIVIPPPNVTGVLTMGHVLNNTIQDILARKARMDGKEVLWLPGTDHAGIGTQVAVEKALRKAGEIKHRDDLGREALVAKIWEWKENYGGIILKQLRALGASCDWTRTRFTMDPEYSRCVQRVFVDLYRKGLIYRGKRMVNWCPASLTALSDEEVVMKEQKGLLYYFKVQVVENDGSPVKPAQPSSSLDSETAETGTGDDGGGADQPVYGPVTDAEGRTWLTIATTRPETIPADTAVAVNPKDPRYAHLIGKLVKRALPLEHQALIPIVGDDHIDLTFGTGVLKVTPAHDKADYEIWARLRREGIRQNIASLRGMEPIEVIAADGRMSELAGRDLAGLDRLLARKKAAEILEAAGTLAKSEPYVNNVGFSERADVPIEPRLSEQWFLKYPSTEPAKACVVQPESRGSASATGAAGGEFNAESTGGTAEANCSVPTAGAQSAAREGACAPRMRFFPDRWAKVYDHWLSGIQDWCISRQLWWGHRIPVWTVTRPMSMREAYQTLNMVLLQDTFLTEPEHREVVLAVDGAAVPSDPAELHRRAESDTASLDQVAERTVVCCTTLEKLGRNLATAGFTQDSDVLDTWFSSWLWPFATMGWTGDKVQDDKNQSLKVFYPTTDLVTGPDIIFFWVARMIMAGYEYMGDLPFRNVYFTGIIRDKQGRKMSKSLGNSPDPLDLIAKYGADALRFGTMRSAPLGQDILFDEQNVELGRNFCNKLWNACRFRQMQGGTTESEINPALLTSDDQWILIRLDQAIREVTQAFADYKFSDATAALYRFFWSEYCDWYVEASKAALRPVEGMKVEELKPGGASALPTPETINPSTSDALRQNKLAVIDFVLGNLLRLFHPFLPFITEELWQGMGFNGDLPADRGGRTIMTATWPQPLNDDEKSYFGLDETADRVAQTKYDLVSLGRGLKRDCKLDPAKKVKFILKPGGALAAAEAEVIRILLNAESLELVPAGWAPPRGTPVAANALGELFLPLAGLVDFAAERARLGKELEKSRAEVTKVQEKLANPNFTAKVPAKVLEEHRGRLAEWQAKVHQLEQAIANLPE